MNYTQKPRQRLLALDTSTSILSVAVMEDAKLLAERNMKAERNHSAYLVTAIEEALAEAGLAKKELDGIAVGVGPGSYTGVRIAVTTAKTLAWSLQLPLSAVSSLAAIALGGFAAGRGQVAEQFALPRPTEAEMAVSADDAAEHWIVPLVDARRGQAYTALFGAAEGQIPHRLEPDAIRLVADWQGELAQRLEALPQGRRPAGVWFVGDTAVHAAALEDLRSLLGEALHIRGYELEAVWLGLVGSEQFLRGAYENVHTLEPNYTQLAEAEAKKLR
ncbi:tRNA (adenosine(37)-N6)-threonylcarbamoyltransferase complex dimerization subunit type 1 TsaB [Paenibacillus lentus]|uniref:tRNA (Adenosine(37)-N6)-threonylcarbamoyltransferase complex dimerization subunit type 1 TsaB n=1 Tax=Paenibacillus lentus TaxID=1338368 RepID=A0A3Q8SAQ8_9BACL|nr:tRNA (adenosine(37)-N6)-threonylcarbamoyltransferase complex dimerization subunit type 1 TsaB [Paenibacillus lentus]AZK46385.1 tRNA (adenosine(37)-N6)-threonylcarbamoyltransferase complex dimerization subunit type 1 TsaB [Paenibacillus lentus]